ncbi:MAG: hypothetical protein ACRDL5_19210 [Solirubrobacteraceae bacterium]
MSANQSTNGSLLTLGSRYPRRVGGLRVAIGVWLLVLTAILAGSSHGAWGWLLVPFALVHFVWAYRLFARAHRREQRLRLS